MSRSSTRNAAATWLQANKPAGITTVLRGHRENVPGSAWGEAGTRFGCVAVIALPSKLERRIAIGGEHSGVKQLDHAVTIKLYFRWFGDAVTTGGDRIEDAEDALDDIIDNLEARLRADRRLGRPANTSGEVWSIDDQLTHSVGEPGLNGQVINILADVNFTATTMLDS